MTRTSRIAAIARAAIASLLLFAGTVASAQAGCEAASPTGPGTVIGAGGGAALGAVFGKKYGGRDMQVVGGLAGGAIMSQVGRCAEGAMRTRNIEVGQPAPATIRVIRGKQMICQPIVVEARMPSGHVLREVRESCQGIDGRVIYSQRP